MSGAIPPIPPYAFMAWCLVKAQGKLYLYLYHDIAPSHKALSLKQFLAQKSITEMEHPPCSHDLAPSNFWLFPKIKSALKEGIFQENEDIEKT
jgi:hypothetical protein